MIYRLWMFFLFGFQSVLFSQSTISGVVVDPSGEPLPFVHILVNNQKDRVFSAELSGDFAIPWSDDIRSLTFSFVGYSPKKFPINGPTPKSLRVVLEPAALDLQEAVVIAGENPAHRIIRNTVANRDSHNPEMLKGYQYRAFTKLTLKMLPDDQLLAEIRSDTAEGAFPFDTLHLFIMETLSRHAFEKPQKQREEILRHRTSGFRQPWFTGIVSQLQPFSFYRDEIPFLEKRYVNPIAPGSTSRYRFRLEETYLDGGDSIFVISFQPFDNRAFVGLKGLLHIHSDGFAIQHLITESADDEKIKFHIDQKYRKTEGGRWFPAQLSLVLDAEKYPNPALGLRVSSRTYLDSIVLEPNFPRGFFSLKNSSITAPGVNTRDSLIILERREPLTLIDSLSFALLDSIGAEAKLDSRMGFLQTMAKGGIQIGKFEWVYTDLFRFSNFEGFTPGFGWRTGSNFSRYFQVYAYGGYAFKPKVWQYKFESKFFLQPENQKNHLGIFISRGLVEPATFDYPSGSISPVTRRFFAQRMDIQHQVGVFAGFQPSRSMLIRISANQIQHEPRFNYAFLNPERGEIQTDFKFAETEIWMRYAWKAQTFRFLGFDSELKSDRPVIALRIAKGWKGIGGGEFNYLRIHGMLNYTLRLRKLGATSMAFEGGWSSEDVPYAGLFTPVGTGAGWNNLSLNYAFETMQPYEFVSNQSAHLYLEHRFGRLTDKKSWFQPQPSLIHRMGWGTLTRPGMHQQIPLKSMEQGYFESGIALNSLLRFNYVNIGWLSAGVKVLYRYGPYRLALFEDNVALRLTLQVSR